MYWTLICSYLSVDSNHLLHTSRLYSAALHFYCSLPYFAPLYVTLFYSAPNYTYSTLGSVAYSTPRTLATVYSAHPILYTVIFFLLFSLLILNSVYIIYIISFSNQSLTLLFPTYPILFPLYRILLFFYHWIFYSAVLYFVILFSSPLYSIKLYSSQLDSSLPHFSPLYSILLLCTLLLSILPFLTLLSWHLFDSIITVLLYSLHFTVPFPMLDPIWLPYSTNLHLTPLFYSALQQTSAVLYPTLIIPPLLYTALLFIWQFVFPVPLSFLSFVVWFLVLIPAIMKDKGLMHWCHFNQSRLWCHICYDWDFGVGLWHSSSGMSLPKNVFFSSSLLPPIILRDIDFRRNI